MKKILLAGESFFRYETHVKGFDAFYTSHYEESAGAFKQAVLDAGYELDYLPSHLVPSKFPYTEEEMKQYAAIVISDVGANSLLLSDGTFHDGEFLGNRCDEIANYVAQGGSFLMIGGYLSFSGIDAKGYYSQTAINDILPVEIQNIDDRVETPQGVTATNVSEHDILSGISEWPRFLGYNRTFLRDLDSVKELVKINDDPLLALREYEKGRTAVFTSDCAPHWGSPEFMNWDNYSKLWSQLINWLTENS